MDFYEINKIHNESRNINLHSNESDISIGRLYLALKLFFNFF